MEPDGKRRDKGAQQGKSVSLLFGKLPGTVAHKGVHRAGHRLRFLPGAATSFRRGQQITADSRQGRAGKVRPGIIPHKENLTGRKTGFLQKNAEKPAAALLRSVGTGGKNAVQKITAAAFQHCPDLGRRQVHI